MATAGPSAPGTMADDSAVGAGVWATVDNAKVNDSSYSTNGSGAPATHYIKATAFGFSIPSGATINGIEVGITRKADNNSKFNYASDNIVKLVKGGSVVGTSKASAGTKWPTSDGTVTYGATSDLWGTTWTDSEINASNFGVVLSANTVSATASVNYISATITYTEGGGGGPVKQMMHTVRMRA